MPGGRVGSLSGRTKASWLSRSVLVSAPAPGLALPCQWPCLVSRFMAGSWVRGSLLGQANSTVPLPISPPPPSPLGTLQLPAPTDSGRTRWRRQLSHSFLSSSWGQQLLLSSKGRPSPGHWSQEKLESRWCE